jgi:hypothetical protein
MTQIALPFDWPAPEGSEAFIVTDANRRAVDGLDRCASWPVRAAILTGPRKSGRSLLARIFAARTGGHIIDDAEQYKESEIFHRWNVAQERREPLLIVAMSPPPIWRISLPDLSSRLAATPVFDIADPDDALIALLLEKLLGQRGVQPGPGAVSYIAGRIERSYIAIMRTVDALDSAALAQHRAITVNLARVVLQDQHLIAAESRVD